MSGTRGRREHCHLPWTSEFRRHVITVAATRRVFATSQRIVQVLCSCHPLSTNKSLCSGRYCLWCADDSASPGRGALTDLPQVTCWRVVGGGAIKTETALAGFGDSPVLMRHHCHLAHIMATSQWVLKKPLSPFNCRARFRLNLPKEMCVLFTLQEAPAGAGAGRS